MRGRRRIRLPAFDWFDWCCLGLLTLLGCVVVVRLLATGDTWTGAEGPVGLDQLQYMTWVLEAGAHGLVGDRWDLVVDHRVFLHPGFLISGLISRVSGASPQLAFVGLWKPVAILATFCAARLWTRTLIDGAWPRRASLFIALFVVMPWSGFLKLFGVGDRIQAYVWGLHLDFPSGEIWTVQPLQGYPMTAIAIALMALVLLAVRSADSDVGLGRVLAMSLGALAVSWLQPWQGAELLIVLAGVELWQRFRNGIAIRWRLAPLFVAGGIPAFYYAWLSASDAAWRLAGEANRSNAQPLWAWPWWAVAATFLPLAVPAALAYRSPTRDWGQLAARAWPFAALAVYLQPLGTFPFHAVQGIMVPLSVLVVQGLTVSRPARLPALPAWSVILLLAFFSIPGTVHKLWVSFNQINTRAYPYTLTAGQEAALAWLRGNYRRVDGAVFTNEYGGLLVPLYTGREAYIGPFSWTPRNRLRGIIAGSVFNGSLQAELARAAVAASGTRFIFQPECVLGRPPLDLRGSLGPLIAAQRTFGCSRVYELRPTAKSAGVSAAIGGGVGGGS